MSDLIPGFCKETGMWCRTRNGKYYVKKKGEMEQGQNVDCGFVKNWIIMKKNIKVQMKTAVENCVEIVDNSL